MQGRTPAGAAGAGSAGAAGSERSAAEERRGQPKPMPGASNKIQVFPLYHNNHNKLTIHRNEIVFGLRLLLLFLH